MVRISLEWLRRPCGYQFHEMNFDPPIRVPQEDGTVLEIRNPDRKQFLAEDSSTSAWRRDQFEFYDLERDRPGLHRVFAQVDWRDAPAIIELVNGVGPLGRNFSPPIGQELQSWFLGEFESLPGQIPMCPAPKLSSLGLVMGEELWHWRVAIARCTEACRMLDALSEPDRRLASKMAKSLRRGRDVYPDPDALLREVGKADFLRRLAELGWRRILGERDRELAVEQAIVAIRELRNRMLYQSELDRLGAFWMHRSYGELRVLPKHVTRSLGTMIGAQFRVFLEEELDSLIPSIDLSAKSRARSMLFEPQTLHDGVMLQLAMERAHALEFRPCDSCGTMMRISPDKEGRRRHTRSCSDACRQKKSRDRRRKQRTSGEGRSSLAAKTEL